MRTPLTSILRLFLLMLPIMLFAMTRGSTGSVTLCTSTENFVGLPQLERNIGVSVEGVTCTLRRDPREGQPGRGTTPFLYAVIVNSSLIVWYGFAFLSRILRCRAQPKTIY